MSEQQQTFTIQQALDLAVQHHNAGRIPEAENIYQQILQNDPNQPVALHLLGVIAHQMGKNDRAVDLIRQALAIRPDYAEAHNNLGIAFKELGKLKEAVTSYQKALSLKPEYPEAHNNLGAALKDLGKLEEAVSSYREALTFNPGYAEAHYNLGNALKEFDQPQEAVASYQKALSLKPNHPETHNNLGNALQKLDKLEDATVSYRKATAIRPDFAMAHNNLGNALYVLGRAEEAVPCHRRAVSLDPQNDLFWSSFAISLEKISFTSVDDDLFQDLLHLLERPMLVPSFISKPILSALHHHPDFSQLLETFDANKQDTEIAYSDIAEQLSTIPLFLRILELSSINDVEIERILTIVRRTMLQETTKGKACETVSPFSAALALHCFTNEYIFAETDNEKKGVEKLEQQIATLMEKGRPVPPSLVVTLGAYRPLFQFPWAQELSKREWENNLTGVIKRQISEPLEEQSLRNQIPCITPIQNAVSQSVREQYEENPYPRWIKTDTYYTNGTIGDVLQGSPFHLDLGDYVSPENPEILIAGCGTGQHVVHTATRFSNAHVLAVDLSLNSLSYALRKTQELDFLLIDIFGSNIEYVQGDITELGKIERQFDLIECIGVLHHLASPLAGWQVLVNLLRPGGLMKIGLYSEIARQHIVLGRSLIAEKGYSSSPDDIRQCRQDIMAMAANGNTEMGRIRNGRSFFNLSECRDLLFHVQEHRFTLLQIEEALLSLDLKFLGFEIRDQNPLRTFRETNPNRNALTSLSLWHEFELNNPNTFTRMYQFWCQKLRSHPSAVR